MVHIPSEYNFTDILSKHWSYGDCYKRLLKPLFHHVGDTYGLFQLDKPQFYDNKYSEDENISLVLIDGEY